MLMARPRAASSFVRSNRSASLARAIPCLLGKAPAPVLAGNRRWSRCPALLGKPALPPDDPRGARPTSGGGHLDPASKSRPGCPAGHLGGSSGGANDSVGAE